MRRLLILFFMLWLPLAALALMPDPLGARNGLRGRGHGLPDEEDLFNVRDRKRFLTDHWPEPSDILDSLVSHDASDIPMEDIRDQLKHDDITDRIQTQDVSHIPMRDVTEAYRARMLERGAPRRMAEGDDTATWWATWGDITNQELNAVIHQSDGRVALAGWTVGFGAGNNDVLFLQVDTSGNLLKAWTWGGTGSDLILALAEQSDGGLVLVGSTTSVGAGNNKALWLQVNSEGELTQAWVCGGAQYEQIHALLERSDKTLALAGVTGSFGEGGADALLLQLDSAGNLIKAAVFGGTGSEKINALVEHSSGKLLLAGSTPSFGQGGDDALLLQVDLDQMVSQAWVWGGVGIERINDVVERSNGVIALIGSTQSFGVGGWGTLLLQVDLDTLSVESASVWGGAGHEEIRAGAEQPEGKLMLAGYTRSFGVGYQHALLLQVDSLGKLVQAGSWGSRGEEITALHLKSDGGLVLAGVSSSLGAGRDDGFILSLGRQGQLPLTAGSALQHYDLSTNLTYTNVSHVSLTAWLGIQSQDITTSIQTQNITDLIAVNASLPASPYQLRDRRLPEVDVASWWATWGGIGNDRIYAMVEQSNGELALAGETNSFGAGGYDVLLLQVDARGELIRAQVWGGTGDEQIYSMIEQGSGHLALAGYTASFGVGSSHALLLQTSAGGRLIQAQAWGGAGNEMIYCLTEQSNGVLALAGLTQSFGGSKALLLQVDVNGVLVRAQGWDGTSIIAQFSAVVERKDGTLVLAGSTSFGAGAYDALLLEVDALGELVQAKVWGGTSLEVIHAMTELSDGTLALAGSTMSFGAGDKDALLLQVDGAGTLIQAQVWGGEDDDHLKAVVERSDRTLALTGQTNSGGAGIFFAALLLQLDVDGNLMRAQAWDGTSSEFIGTTVECSDGALVLAGFTNSFGAGGADVFILSLNRDDQLALPIGSPLQQLDITANLTWTNVSSTPLVPWTTIQSQDITSSIQSQNITSLIVTNASLPTSAYQLRDYSFPEVDVASWWATWGGSENEEIKAILTQSEGTLALAGYTDSFGSGGHDALLLQIEAGGKLRRAQVWGGAGDDKIYDMVEQSDGGLTLVGCTSGFGSGLDDGLLLQLSSKGGVYSAQVWGGSHMDQVHALVQQSDGVLALAGWSSSFNAGSSDALLLRLDTSGYLRQAWTWGAGDSDEIYALAEQKEGVLVLVGWTDGFGAGDDDVLLLRVNTEGVLTEAQVWGGTGTDQVYALTKQTSGGLVLVGGTTSFGAGSWDGLLLQLDGGGALVQAQALGGVDEEIISAITEQSDGVLALGGWTEGFGVGDTNALLLQLDSTGVLTEARIWGGASADYLYALAEQSDGTLVLAGSTWSFGENDRDGLILSLNQRGWLALPSSSPLQQLDITANLTLTNVSSTPLVPWTTIQSQDITSSIQSQNITSLIVTNASLPTSAYQRRDRSPPKTDPASWWATWGGAGNDQIFAAIQKSDETLALVGYTTSFGAGDYDALLLQVDAAGELRRAQVWVGTAIDQIYAIVEQSDGSLALAGGTTSFGAGDYDALLLQLSAGGDLIQAQVWGAAGSEQVYAIVEQSDGRLALGGHTNSFGASDFDALLLQTSAAGSLVQAKAWGGTSFEIIRCLVERSSGTLALAGYTSNFDASSDALLLELDAAGELVQAHVWGGPELERIEAAVERSDKTLVLAGYTTSFGMGGAEALLLQVDSEGELRRAQVLGGVENEYLTALTERSDGTLALIGYKTGFGAGGLDALLLQMDEGGALTQARVWGGAGNDFIVALVEQPDATLFLAGTANSFVGGKQDGLMMSLDNANQLALPAESVLQQADVIANLTLSNVSSVPWVSWTTIQSHDLTASIQVENITESLVSTFPPDSAYQFNGSFVMPPSPSPSPSATPSFFVSSSHSASLSVTGSPSRLTRSSVSFSPTGFATVSQSASARVSVSLSLTNSPSPFLTLTPTPAASAKDAPALDADLERAWRPNLVLAAPEYVYQWKLPLAQLHSSFIESPVFEPPLGQLTGVDWQSANSTLLVSGNRSMDISNQRLFIRQGSVLLALDVRRRSQPIEVRGLPQFWLINQGEKLCFSPISLYGKANGALVSNVTLLGPGSLQPQYPGLASSQSNRQWLLGGPLSSQMQRLNQLCYQSQSPGEAKVLINMRRAWETVVSGQINIAVQPTIGNERPRNEVTLSPTTFEQITRNQTVEVLALMQDETPLLPWITFNQTALSLKANPPDSISGEYRAMLLIRNQTDELMRLPAVFFFDPPVSLKVPTLWDTITPESFISAMVGGALFCFVLGTIVYSSLKRRQVRALMASYTNRVLDYQDSRWVDRQQSKGLDLLARLNEQPDQIEVAASVVMLLLPAALQAQQADSPLQARLMHCLLTALTELYQKQRSALTKERLLPHLRLIEWQLALLAWDLHLNKRALTENQRDQLLFLIKKVNRKWRKPCRGDKEAKFLMSCLQQGAILLPYQGVKGGRLVVRQLVNVISPLSSLKFIYQALSVRTHRWYVDGLWLRQLASFGRTDERTLAVLSEALDQAKGREAIQMALQALTILAKRWPDRFKNLPLQRMQRWTVPKQTAQEVKTWLMAYKKASEMSVTQLRQLSVPSSATEEGPDHLEHLSAKLLVEEEDEMARIARVLTTAAPSEAGFVHANPLHRASRMLQDSFNETRLAMSRQAEDDEAISARVHQNPLWRARETDLSIAIPASRTEEERKTTVTENPLAFFNSVKGRLPASRALRFGDRPRSQEVAALARQKEREARLRKKWQEQAAQAAWKAKPLISLFENRVKKQRGQEQSVAEPTRFQQG